MCVCVCVCVCVRVCKCISVFSVACSSFTVLCPYIHHLPVGQMLVTGMLYGYTVLKRDKLERQKQVNKTVDRVSNCVRYVLV